ESSQAIAAPPRFVVAGGCAGVRYICLGRGSRGLDVRSCRDGAAVGLCPLVVRRTLPAAAAGGVAGPALFLHCPRPVRVCERRRAGSGGEGAFGAATAIAGMAVGLAG